MPTGFGIIDYIVVIASLVLASYLLTTRPQRLLLFLPTLVTIDFFIPFLSQLTPGRLVPLLIAAWWGFTWRLPMKRWLLTGVGIVIIATLFGMLMGDSGARPGIRAVSYLNLLILLGFSWQFATGKTGNRFLFQGFALAGVVHGFYSVYQILANRLGLPYRGIVYSADETGGGMIFGEAFRVNGLADEPKRLGLILLAGAIALVYLALCERGFMKRYLWHGVAVMIFLISFLTYSASYLVAVVIWVPVAVLLSSQGWKYGIGLSLVAGALMVFMGDTVRLYMENQQLLMERREMEMDQGLDAQKVYRQEFFAGEYLRESPMTVLTGVGMGRYYEVLNLNYGAGAGIDLWGGLLPLNSQPLEVIFDTGLPGFLLGYVGGIVLIWKVRRKGKAGYLLAALIAFELIQSLFVQSLPLLMIAMGGGAAMVWAHCDAKAGSGRLKMPGKRQAAGRRGHPTEPAGEVPVAMTGQS